MCGVAGVKRFGETPIPEEVVRVLFAGMEHRGTDASGIATEFNGTVTVLKDDVPAWQFMASHKFKKFIAEKLPTATTVLIHTRAATGNASPRKQDNNHPLFHKNVAIIHNGMINNDDTLFREMKLERHAETDTDIIRAILDKEGFTRQAVRQLSRMSGSAAIAAVSPESPGYLLLGRSGSTLVTAYEKETDLFYWASEKAAIHQATRKWEKLRGFYMQAAKSHLYWRTVPNDSIYLIGPEELEWHQEFKTSVRYVQPNYTKQYSEYDSRQKRFDKNVGELKMGPKLLGTPVDGGKKEKDEEDPDIVDARTFVQCELCEKWSYFTQPCEDVVLSEVVCGWCGEMARKKLVLQ